ncbi:hypothetical protein BU25DRAFT_426137 [Macroventuria anomochaeta]|uniref:Uncharacterized protein n=1 Tax=Macroventuria anomochaeta TaxID=301207 RepID=A0ACB6RIV0_9PLEO|nr:uncharacterized protein BU25DRAFT_426137 [Macroventuria anomochaeta]KAF2621875.1 hypothetical protein BU25DRAFT_426137 [Macroventuria anomochaeta]
MADAIHYETIGTLFASQGIAASAPQETMDMERARQTGPESSIFAIHDAHARQRRDAASNLATDLQKWLDGFDLPQAYADRRKNSAAEHAGIPPRKLSLSVHAADYISTELSAQASAVRHNESTGTDAVAPDHPAPLGDKESDDNLQNERLNLVLFNAFPMSPVERTPEWGERQRVREEYDAIERARANLIDQENAMIETRKRWLEENIRRWGVDQRQLRAKEKRRGMAINIVLFDALAYNDGPIEGTRPMLDPAIDRDKDYDYIKELSYNGFLLGVAEEQMVKDTNMYMIPEPWYMGHRPRHRQPILEEDYIERYLRQEARLIPLIDQRLDYLRKGKSAQSEADIVAEIKGLERTLLVHKGGESNNVILVQRLLKEAAYCMEVEQNAGTHDTLRRHGTPVTDHVPPFMKQFIRSFPRLLERFHILQETEKRYFPERFEPRRRPQPQPQCTPSGRQIPMRQPQPSNIQPKDGSTQEDDRSVMEDFGYPLERVDSPSYDPRFQYDPRSYRTLPRSFRTKTFKKKTKIWGTSKLAVLLSRDGDADFAVPILDRLMEPTSLSNDPETGNLQRPKFRLNIPVRMSSFDRPGVYIPPQPHFQLKKPATERIKKRFVDKEGLDADQRAFTRLNHARDWLSLAQDKRHRGLQEPLMPDNIDKAVERHRTEDLKDLQRRHDSIESEVLQNYINLMNQFKALYYEDVDSFIGEEDAEDTGDDESSGRTLRVVNPDPPEDFEQTGDAGAIRERKVLYDVDRVGNIRYSETLEDNETFLRVVHVRTENVGSTVDLDPAHLVENIEDIDRVENPGDTFDLPRMLDTSKHLRIMRRSCALFTLAKLTTSETVEGLRVLIDIDRTSLLEHIENVGITGNLAKPGGYPAINLEVSANTYEQTQCRCHRVCRENKVDVTVTEIEISNSEDEANGQAPARLIEPAERSPSRAQESFTNEVEVMVTEVESSDGEDEESDQASAQ